MNIKKRNSRQLHHPLHMRYLTLFPTLFMIAFILVIVSLYKARQDLKMISLYTQGIYQSQDRGGLLYHKVRSFDTIESLAEEYGISVDTILWANDIDPQYISENTIIIIPPVTGIVHTVKNRETIESIAAKYGVAPEKIREYPYNEFSDDEVFPITPGQILIVPDGKK